MKFPSFDLERIQSIYENSVEINLTESGIEPLSLKELMNSEEIEELLNFPLGYGYTQGSPLLRSRISDLYEGCDKNNVLVTSGSSEAIFLSAVLTVSEGDKVVMMTPNYLSFNGIAEALGAEVNYVPLIKKEKWKWDLETLDAMVGNKTKVISICNPNNPTGSVLSTNQMEKIIEIAQKVGAYLLVDEVYIGAELGLNETKSFIGLYEKTIITSGLSKSYSNPGLRIGWIISDKGFAEEGKYADALKILQEKMGDSARNQQIVRAGAGKSEFADWYATKSNRVGIVQNGMGEKKVEQYLRAELAMFGIPKKGNRNQQKLIDKMVLQKVTPITKDEINNYGKIFSNTDDAEWEIGSGASAGRTAKRKGISGKDAIMVGHDHIEDLLKNPEKELSGSRMKEQIADVVETSMESKEWKKVLDDAFATDDELRQWIMYEAGSGYGKFTGKGKEGNWTKYTPGMRSVANYMVVWNKDGSIKYEGDMVKYAQANGDKVKNLDISYKSSGRSSYIKLGLFWIIVTTTFSI